MIKYQLKNTFNFAWPIVVSDIIEALEAFVIVAMVAYLGAMQIAANCLVWRSCMVIFLFFMGPFSIVSVITAQNVGAKDRLGVVLVFKQGLITAMLSSVIIIPLLWYAPAILVWTKQDQQVIANAIPFFHAIIWAVLPDGIAKVIKQFLCGLGKTKILMFVVMIATIIRLLFCYCFIFGKFGLPQLGILGIAYAMLISGILTVIMAFLYLHYAEDTKNYCFFHRWWIIDSKCLLEVLRVGLPTGLMWSIRSGFFAAITFIMGSLGVVVIAAYQIAYQFLKLPLTIIYSLAQSAAVMTSKNIGNKNYGQLKLTCAAHMLLGFVAIFGFCFFYLLAPEMVLKLDSGLYIKHNFDVIDLALKFFPLMVIYLVIQSISIIYNGILRGLKDANFQLICNLFSSWVLALPIAYVFGVVYGYGGSGVWFGTIIGSLVATFVLMLRFFRLMKVNNSKI